MATRPLVFGARFREGGRTVEVRAHARDPRRYVLEVKRAGGAARREQHGSLAAALRGFARAWRGRLH